MSLSFLVNPRQAEGDQNLQELTRESLRNLLPLTAVLAWLLVALAVLFAETTTVYAYLVLGLTWIAAWASHRLSEKRLSIAIAVYVLSLTVATMIIVVALDEPGVLYVCVQVVIITAMLTNPLVTWGVALANVVVMLAVGLYGRVAMPSELVVPAVFVVLTAAVFHASSYRMFSALDWALRTTEEARRHAEAAREHRAEVVRLLKSLDEAYVRLERVNEELFLAREAAQRAYRFKADFVANVSHELRTPLNLIVGFSEMMVTAPETYGGVPLPKEYRGDVMAVYRSARHLSQLIDDVLDLSRIEAKSMPLVREETDLAEIAHEALEMVRGLAEARRLELALDVQDRVPSLSLDRTRIRQVLLNLLTNATRFTDQGGIRVRIRREDHSVVVTVEDSGRGIPPDRITGAFQAFTQLDDDQVRKGTGLGLAVSKQFVELHGGTMWIESEVNQGTTVGFSLPVPGAPRAVQVSHLTLTAALPRKLGDPRVLILHDDPRELSLVQRHVKGCQFSLAETVDQARELIPVISPAAVVVSTTWEGSANLEASDLNLPPDIPLISCPLPSTRRIGTLLGAADYLIKPVTQQDLRDALLRLPALPEKVLIVDDDPQVVRLLARMLATIDPAIRVLKAFDGHEAIELIRSDRPDLMLLDLVMPTMNGEAVLAEMAQDRTIPETQAIVVSAQGPAPETLTLPGHLRLERLAGFSLTEGLKLLQAVLGATTRTEAMDPGTD